MFCNARYSCLHCSLIMRAAVSVGHLHQVLHFSSQLHSVRRYCVSVTFFSFAVPSKALGIIKVSSSNSSLIFKWERPEEDNGSKLTNYIMTLYASDGTLYDQMVKNGTGLDRRHFMSLWSGLDAGKTFTFKVIHRYRPYLYSKSALFNSKCHLSTCF